MRTKNEKNVYNLTCKVTGKVFKTNPKQFNATTARLGVSDEVLQNNYVSRDGRRILREGKLTAAQVVATYGVDPVVANQLKNLAKETPAPAETANIAVEVPATAIAPETAPAADAADAADVAPVAETEVAVAA